MQMNATHLANFVVSELKKSALNTKYKGIKKTGNVKCKLLRQQNSYLLHKHVELNIIQTPFLDSRSKNCIKND